MKDLPTQINQKENIQQTNTLSGFVFASAHNMPIKMSDIYLIYSILFSLLIVETDVGRQSIKSIFSSEERNSIGVDLTLTCLKSL